MHFFMRSFLWSNLENSIRALPLSNDIFRPIFFLIDFLWRAYSVHYRKSKLIDVMRFQCTYVKRRQSIFFFLTTKTENVDDIFFSNQLNSICSISFDSEVHMVIKKCGLHFSIKINISTYSLLFGEKKTEILSTTSK